MNLLYYCKTPQSALPHEYWQNTAMEKCEKYLEAAESAQAASSNTSCSN